MHTADSIEVTLLVMLQKIGQKVVELAGVDKKYLALAIHDILLQIVGYRFSRAEIFHSIRHSVTHLFTKTEKMIDSSTCCKYYCREVRKGYA